MEKINDMTNVCVSLNRHINNRSFRLKCFFLYWIFVFVWTGLENLWEDRHILFISLPSSLFPVPFQAVFMPAKSISWLLWMLFLSLEFTGVTNSAVIWENSSQLVSIHHLHYYHCNLSSLSHFLSHSTCYQAMGFLSFGHTTLSIISGPDSYAAPSAHVALWLKCSDMAERRLPVPCTGF